jgi:predicted DNA-binding transcriptional regulator YafY
MLQKILEILKDHDNVVSYQEICTQLEISEDTLEHMLETLVRKGHLVEGEASYPENCPHCDNCPVPTSCDLIKTKDLKVYRVVEE